MPTERKVAETQRMRWEGMTTAMRGMFIKRIARKMLERPRACYLDALMGLLVPPLAVLVLAQIMLLAATSAMGSVLAFPLACCLLVDVFYVCSGLILRGAGGRNGSHSCARPSTCSGR
jgi:hypothetical protein